jgi:hypothetical protein
MSNERMFRETYEYMLDAPIYRDLNLRIQELEAENKTLRRILLHLGNQLPDLPISSHAASSQLEKKDVFIKVEKKPSAMQIVSQVLEVVDLTESDQEAKQNIVYEIIDDALSEEIDEVEVVEGEEDEEEVEDVEGVEEEEEEEEEVVEVEAVEEVVEVEGVEEEEEEEEEVVEVEGVEEEEEEEEETVEEEEEDEETVEVVEGEEEEEEEVVEVEEEEEETVEVEEEEEVEYFEVSIKGKRYYTSDLQNGEIYSMIADDEIGDLVGRFVKGVSKFNM